MQPFLQKLIIIYVHSILAEEYRKKSAWHTGPLSHGVRHEEGRVGRIGEEGGEEVAGADGGQLQEGLQVCL